MSIQEIPVRNPRTGTIEFTFKPTPAEEIAARAARLRANQKAWAARPIRERVGIMRRWIAELAAHARVIGAADGADTGGCHTSQFTAFIAIANISGWCEDAEGVLERAHVSGQAITMPTVQIRSQLVPYPLVGVISPWNAPMMLSLLDAVPALFAGSAVLLKPSEVTPRFVEPLMHTRARGAGTRGSVRRGVRRWPYRAGCHFDRSIWSASPAACPPGARSRWPVRSG